MADSGPAILVVDDNASKRLAVVSILAPLGHTVIEAESGVAALRKVTERPFAAILMDVVMPLMNGYEAADLIRARSGLERTPIIFITAHALDEAQIPLAYASGAVDFIFAPIVPNILRAKVSFFVDLFVKSSKLERLGIEHRENEAHMRGVLDNVAEGIVTIDHEGVIESFNRAATAFFGYDEREAIGQPFARMVPPLTAAQRAASGVPPDSVGHRKDGSTFPIEIDFSDLGLGARSIRIGCVRDISERRRAERRLEAEYGVASVLAESPELDAGLERILATLGRGLGWEVAALWMVGDDEAALTCRHFWKAPGIDVAEFEEATRELRMSRGEGLMGSVWANDEPKWLPGIGSNAEDNTYMRSQPALRCGLRSSFAIPITVANRVLGVMEFLSHHAREPDLELLQVLGVIGGEIGRFIQRARADESLRLSETRLAEAQCIAHIGSWEWDVVAGNVILSDQLLHLFGFEPDEFAGTYEAYLELVHPDDRTFVEAKVGEAVETASPTSYEGRVIRCDGAVRIFHTDLTVDVGEDGRAVRVAGTAQDVTESTEAGQKLRASEERFRRLFEFAAVGIALMDREGRIFSANPAFEHMLGYQPGGLEGVTVLEITHEDEREVTSRYIDALVSGEQPEEHREKRYVRRDGGVVWANLSASLVQDAEGKPDYCVSIVEDITERKQLQEQFIQAQKMEAVGRLAGGIAHDFNNLLLAINGFSELALSEIGQDDDSVRGSVSSIKDAGQRAAKLTRELLAFSRKEVLQPVVADLNEITQRTEGLIRQVIGASIELSLALDPGLGRAMLDPSRLEQAIMNLSINARDSMHEGGRLAISTSNVSITEPQPMAGADLEPGSYVVIAVGDTGHGMDEETQSRIFEPFFTTKEREQGTGFGLATVFGFVTQSNGHVRVSSAPGRGTTFELFFPRVFDAPATNGGPVDAATDHVGTILLVEDEDMVRNLLSKVLTKRGYHVVEACTGLEAVDIADHYSGKVDVLVTDLVMPGMGGVAAAEHIVRNHPEAAVIFMSGYTNEVAALDTLAGDVVFLQKPFSSEDLLAKIESALARSDDSSSSGDLSASIGALLPVENEEMAKELRR